MTDDHKDAIRQGRLQANAIKAYLESLMVERRGRTSDPATLQKRLKEIEARIEKEDNVLKALELRQQRSRMQEQLEYATGETDYQSLEEAFVEHAAEYSDRKGITYAVWREMGVPPRLLKEAGIPR